MKRFLLIVVLSGVLKSGICQSPNMPTIIPPSPAAQAIMKYGEIPVDYSTGVPNISVPLYTVKGKKLELPISISYHASGIKSEDIASEVGLGWVLNCGGLVSRSIFGIPDEFAVANKTFKSAQQLLDSIRNLVTINQNQSTLDWICPLEYYFANIFPYEDVMSDRFFYNLPTGVSGVFMYDYVSSSNLITLPYRPLKISGFTKGHSTDSIKITDESGIVYVFKPFGYYSSGYTEWYLTKMISADASDTISLTYNILTGNQSPQSTSYTLLSPPVGPPNCQPGVDDVQLFSLFPVLSPYASPISTFYTPVLNSVISSNATINFTYANDRSDFSQLRRLTDITITPVNSVAAIKTIHFSQSYFGSNNTDYRLRLDNLTISAPADTHPQEYGFTYESQMLPPYPFNMSDPRYGEDYWGYYNGTSSPFLFQADFITDPVSYGTNREADNGTYARACMIKEIQYPTGGSTIFHFGRNYAQNVYQYKTNPAGYIGGFRIDSLTNYNENNQITDVKSYQYDDYVIKPITQDYFKNVQYYGKHFSYQDNGYTQQCTIQYSQNVLYPNPVLPFEVAPGLPIMYTTVTEYNGNPANNAGKTVYEYNMPYSPTDFEDNPDHPDLYESVWFYHPYHYDKGNYVPELIAKTDYSFDGTTYHPVIKTENTYTKLYTQSFETGIKFTKTKQYVGTDYFSGIICNFGIGYGCGPLIEEYVNSNIAIDTKAYQEASLITNSKNYVYNPTDATQYVLTTTNYTYNPVNLAVQEKTTTSSKGDVLISAYRYPADVSGTVYSEMVAKNIIAPVVAQTDSINTNFLQTITTNYTDWGNNVLAPASVTRYKGTIVDTLIRYTYNTLGNLVEAYKNKDAITSYLWGYHRQYPVAKILGSSYNTANGIVPQLQLDAATGSANNDIAVRALLNNLRTGLPGALVNTYTYAPAIGMTSQTDPAGYTNYYVYDGFGRLKLMLDKDQNVRKKFGYEYSGQTENTSDVYYMGAESQDFTRNNCGSGSTGTTVTYSAYSNSAISQADANAKALADLAANGQNYANTYGHCGQLIPVTINNAATSDCYGVEFCSSSVGVDLFFDISNGYSSLGTIPAGIYDYIGFYNDWGSCSGSNSFRVTTGGTNYNASSVNTAYFPNISVSGSCSITIQ